ncbi:AtpZ/AtpI family protein [Flavobacterium silvisoli]|uniref:AtpZ/AtpI family protein n=1 Tax=Flavobacterium silvisoli TaxID=2529433 RepID=A0A4Q9Z486_9FLAO|nr:AtpZ/AtpI family protein [Flavobacterium silvisoli]TBX71255.1 AtpZ/AtpI family protein [Flavobacterium silvisoli]
MDNLPKKKQPNKWLTLISIPTQMGVIVFLFAYFGQWLDAKYPNEKNWYVKIMVLVGVAIAFYNINRQLKEINKNE